ncbi:ribokinase [Bacillus sp. UMB0899]|uniref:ribokinase n=1 Tax=Metabacillus schmidteae TaxID=2730405 RepID=UPI000C805463|nr:ribokinase [Metabacillus schmidteae]PMC35913.1 ribokinase [Bacillus sp. UMB0899]
MNDVNIVVVGSINMDLVIFTNRFPNKGETIIGEEFHRIPGGKGANQAVAAKRLGANVDIIGCIGDDIYGKEVIGILDNEDIGTECISIIPNKNTGIALITVNKHGENKIILSQGANSNLSPTQIRNSEHLIKKANVLLLQLEIPIESIVESVKIAKRHNIPVILNPAPAIKLEPALLEQIDYLIPNETESKQLVGKDFGDTEEIIDTLKEIGVSHTIVTLGEKGVVFNDQTGKIIHIDAHKVKAIDTTGAGDAFNAAFGVSIAEGKTITESIHFAQTVAAYSVTKSGAQPSFPNRSEVTGKRNN